MSPAPSGRLHSIRGGSAIPGQDKATLVWVKQSVQSTFSSGGELPPYKARGFYPLNRAPHFVSEGPWAVLPIRPGLSTVEGGDGGGVSGRKGRRNHKTIDLNRSKQRVSGH